MKIPVIAIFRTKNFGFYRCPNYELHKQTADAVFEMMQKSISEDEMESIMDKTNNIRNITVSHLDNVKSNLFDILQASSRSLHVPISRFMDTCADERERPVNLKSDVHALFFNIPSAIETPKDALIEDDLLINWIESSRKIDYYTDIPSLRIADGCMVLSNAITGEKQNTNTLRQALAEHVIPVLLFNKMEHPFLERRVSSEEIYQLCLRELEQTNLVLSAYYDDLMGQLFLSPESGNVGFISIDQKWGFSLNTFASLYASRFGMDKQKLVQRFWGDNYYDSELKQWTTKAVSDSGKPLSRAFCKFVLDPIHQLWEVVSSANQQKLESLLRNIGVVLSEADKSLTGVSLMNRILNLWLPAHKVLLELALKLPSPVQAQKYRVRNLYTGPQDDTTAAAIRTCNRDGPLVVYISKMKPEPYTNGRFYGIGRVFAGNLSPGMKVRIMGPEYQYGKKNDLYLKTVQAVLIQTVGYSSRLGSCAAGNLCHVIGIDQYILKTATLASDETSYPIVTLKFSTSPVLSVVVTPKNPADLPKIVDGLRKLAKSDPVAHCTWEDTGECVIAGTGEQHLELLLNDFQHEFLKGVDIVVSDPIVAYRETVLEESYQVCLAISPNKHNRLWCKAKPLEQRVVDAIQRGEITQNDDPKNRARLLADEYGWDLHDAKNIWAFGPESIGTNILVKAGLYGQEILEIKDSTVTAFQWVTKEGALANERMHGIRFDILDVVLHSDAIHRGGGQIIPTARKVFYAAQLTATPRMMEPVYLFDIQCPSSVVAQVFSVINHREGQIIEEVLQRVSMSTVTCYMPVSNSLGITEELMRETGGQVVFQCLFSHWGVMQDDPLGTGTKSEELVRAIRKRKGLNPEVPTAGAFM